MTTWALNRFWHSKNPFPTAFRASFSSYYLLMHMPVQSDVLTITIICEVNVVTCKEHARIMLSETFLPPNRKRWKWDQAFRLVIEEIRKEPGSPTEIRKRLDEAIKKYPDRTPWSSRTVEACLKRGIELGIFKKIQDGRYAWDCYDERGERMKEIVEELKRQHLRYPTTKEIAVKVGMPPESVEFTSKLYTMAEEVDWREPTPEEVERTAGKNRLEVIIDLVEDPDSKWLKNYCTEEEIEEARKERNGRYRIYGV